jgi:hypothetical protein
MGGETAIRVDGREVQKASRYCLNSVMTVEALSEVDEDSSEEVR